MKPIAIEFQAFGSYPGREHIDFSLLAERGLFVVSGDTGTGKTTIFDAMCFALYGVMPLKDGKEIRSHHASIEDRTYVKFTFDSDGVRYVVERSPEQERPSRRGGGVVMEKATVSLLRLEAGGSRSLATKSADAVARCIEIVGLEAEQFKRVILLPQGDFSRFLLDSTSGREELLGQLFGGEIYDDIVEELKRREADLRRIVGTLQSDIDHRLANARAQTRRAFDELGIQLSIGDDADRHAIGVAVVDAAEPFNELSRRVVLAAADATRRHTDYTTAHGAASRFDQARAYRIAIDDLLDAQSAADAHEVAANASAQARPVVLADDDVADARARAEQRTALRDQRLKQIDAEFAALAVTVDLGDAASVLRAIDDQRRQVEDNKQAISAHDAATLAQLDATKLLDAFVDERQRAVAEIAAAGEQLLQMQRELDAVTAMAVDLDVLDARIAVAEARVRDHATASALSADLVAATERCESTAAAHRAALARFVSTQAPRLAAELRDGEPCAVCGSREHPAPARDDEMEPTSFEQVQQLSSRCTEADAARRAVEAALAEARGRLGEDATRPEAELTAAVVALHGERVAAKAAHVERDRLSAALNSTEARLATLGQSSAALDARIEAAERDLDRCRRAKDVAAAAMAGIDAETVAAAERSVLRLASITQDLSALTNDVLAAGEALRSAEQRCVSALVASGLDSVVEARAKFLELAVEAERRGAAERHRRELADRRANLEALAQQGIPDERPDDEALRAVADEARNVADRLTVRHTTVSIALDDAAAQLAEHDRLVVESGDVRETHLLARRAYKVCSEGGIVNMPLRRWVLAIELDRVASAGNVHLQRMTGGRYTVRRRQEMRDGRKAFGLDLEVLDAHTGRARATSSLSGGEQFQASLSLALGLADVVSHGGSASGKRFEALFVDEGFGSLDPTALHEAIGALHQLRATGRMVGVITHVEDMKRDLHVGIEVTRLGDGRGSTLVVHP